MQSSHVTIVVSGNDLACVLMAPGIEFTHEERRWQHDTLTRLVHCSRVQVGWVNEPACVEPWLTSFCWHWSGQNLHCRIGSESFPSRKVTFVGRESLGHRVFCWLGVTSISSESSRCAMNYEQPCLYMDMRGDQNDLKQKGWNSTVCTDKFIYLRNR